MSYSTTIEIDLAKNVIQVSVVSEHGKELLNRPLARRKFGEFLDNQKPSLVAFEACASAHFWARTALRLGHEVKIIPAKPSHRLDRVTRPIATMHWRPLKRLAVLTSQRTSSAHI